MIMKIGNLIISDRDRLNLQEDLRKISEWSERWEMFFNVNTSHILQLGTGNQDFDYEINGVKHDSVQCVKILAFRLRQTLNSPSDARMPWV